MLGEVGLHYGQRGSSPCHPIWKLGMARRIRGQMFYDETRGRHVGLVAVLLEEHPLQDLRALQAIIGYEPATFGQVPEDGIRFGNTGTVSQLQRGYAAVGVLGE